jgi:23S rRNA-/tRNA-specific pseudouridylate synthase
MCSRYLVLGESFYDGKSYQWSFNSRSSKDSASEESYSYLKIVIDTGKKHQIRLHCNYALKTPIFGDTKYGFDQA